MAEEKKEPWLGYLALTTVILAVCATLSTFKGGGYSTRSVMSQQQASDLWAFYQAKSIKGNLYQVQSEALKLEIEALPAGAAAEKIKLYKEKLADYDKRVARYTSEQAQIQTDAKKLEAQRDDAQRHGQPFGMAVIFLQVSILLSSIAGLMKRKEVWYCALPIGGLGMIYFANGFFLFM